MSPTRNTEHIIIAKRFKFLCSFLGFLFFLRGSFFSDFSEVASSFLSFFGTLPSSETELFIFLSPRISEPGIIVCESSTTGTGSGFTLFLLLPTLRLLFCPIGFLLFISSIDIAPATEKYSYIILQGIP